MTKTVVFDLDGVLIDHDPRYLYRKLLPTENEVTAFLTDICHNDWNEKQDAGRSLVEVTAERISKFPDHSELSEAYYGRWEEMRLKAQLKFLRSCGLLENQLKDCLIFQLKLMSRHVNTMTLWTGSKGLLFRVKTN